MLSIIKIQSLINNGQLQLSPQSINLLGLKELLSFIKLDNLTFTSVRVVDDSNGDILISGDLMFFSTLLTNAKLYIYTEPNNEMGYSFELQGTLEKITLQEIYDFDFINKNPLNEVDLLLNLNFPRVNFSFSEIDKRLSLHVIDSKHKIDFFSIGLSLYNLGFYYDINIEVEEKKGSKYLISGSLNIGSTTVPVKIQIPSKKRQNTACWSLQLGNELPLENALNDLSTFFSQNDQIKPILGNQKLTEHLPEALKEKKSDLYLDDLKILFNPIQPAIFLVEVTLDYDTNWEIISGFTLKNIGLNIFTTFHGSNVACTLKLFGNFSFVEDVHVGFSFILPLNKKDDWVISLNGYADIDKLDKLESLNLFKLESLKLPSEWLMVEELRLHKLIIVFNPFKKKLKTVEVEIHLTAQSEIIPGITIKNPELEFFIDFEHN